VIATVPFIPGHEAVGTVAKVGPTATLKVWANLANKSYSISTFVI